MAPTKFFFVVLLVLVFATAPLCMGAETVRVGVFGLFHPAELSVSAAPGNAIVIRAGKMSYTLEGERRARIRVTEGKIAVTAGRDTLVADRLTASARDGGAAEFLLSVPGRIVPERIVPERIVPERIRRRFRGTLQVSIANRVLAPVVTMDLETAVASVVAAESPPGAPLEALKAQAIVARSYFVAGSTQHELFDFCDTTHCQFLRAAPSAQHSASVAARATRGLVLTYEGTPLAAMYSARCGGHTRSLREIGVEPHGYPYYSVECRYCRNHPQHWQRTLPVQEAAALTKDNGNSERSRLALGRQRGWDAVPSNSYHVKEAGTEVILTGHGAGHGVGLCQQGAAAMAASGARFEAILEHYYPNTAVVQFVAADRR